MNSVEPGKAWQEGAWPETAPKVVPDMPMPVYKTVHVAELDAGRVVNPPKCL